MARLQRWMLDNPASARCASALLLLREGLFLSESFSCCWWSFDLHFSSVHKTCNCPHFFQTDSKRTSSIIFLYRYFWARNTHISGLNGPGRQSGGLLFGIVAGSSQLSVPQRIKHAIVRNLFQTHSKHTYSISG